MAGVDDTHPHARAVQLRLLREASRAQRFERVRSLTQTVVSLSRRAIRRAHPDASDDEIAFEFLAVHYGRELARRWREARR